LNPSNLSPVATNVITGVSIPTFNPYYPVGNAPSNLRAYYNIGWESPGITTFYELAQRPVGLNIALPGGGRRVWYSMTQDANQPVSGATNRTVSAALGGRSGRWDLGHGARIARGRSRQHSLSEPALRSDAFQCNSLTTIAYVQGIRSQRWFWINERAQFDGRCSIFGRPAKAAIGGPTPA
jgi:hypothetical protein